MKQYTAHLTSRVVACAACLVLLAAATSSYAAPPRPDRPSALVSHPPVPAASVAAEVAGDELLGRMLTPTAEIRLGPGRADTQRLMRRSAGSSLLYGVRSAWRGIVEYLFPPHGLFRRGEPLVRVYDPKLLSDLERARALMATADVSPLTIATSSPEYPDERPDERIPAPAAEPIERAPTEDPSPATRLAPPIDPAEIAFDFAANQREQAALRERAAAAADAVSVAMTAVRASSDVLAAAREELAQRRELLEAGVLAEQALQPAQERSEQALAEWEAAQGKLLEAQRTYDGLAARIAELEQQAAAAHEALRRARDLRARAAMAGADHASNPTAPQTSPQGGSSSQPPPVELRRADEAERPQAGVRSARSLPLAHEVRELAAPRWNEITADAPGMVSEVLVPEGTLVAAGEELMRVANLQLAQVTAAVALDDLPEFRVGRAVTLSFNDYPEAVFEGWVASVAPGEEQSAEVELLVVCESGPFADDAYLALRWMTLQAGIGEDKVDSRTLEPVCEPEPSARTRLRLFDIFPTIGPDEAWAARATELTVPRRDRYAGRLRLRPMPRFTAGGQTDETAARRLAAIEQWRASYIEGMTTSILDDGTTITYPADGEVCTAVRSMLSGRVSHRPNLCAATMREALGWGLGDAHQWARRLPAMGYVERADGLPRPGDILVWPFTFGPGHSQHIGIAVRQGRKLMLLSNLDGRLGTSEILGGYLAFYRPTDEADGPSS